MEALNHLLGLGLEPKDLTFVQISLRGAIVFVVANLMLRMADRRFLSKMSALDAILGFILASMLARVVNGSSAFFPSLGAGFVLVLIHRLFAWLAQRSHWFGELVKGHADPLIENGRVNQETMRANHLSERDLLEELREQGQVSSPEEVKTAALERSGKISVIPFKKDS